MRARHSPKGDDGPATAKSRRDVWYIYNIRGTNFPDQDNTGATADLKQRITDHNAGKSPHIAKFKPWKRL
jgi:predicted GIY-YIG superfamily endonuclease